MSSLVTHVELRTIGSSVKQLVDQLLPTGYKRSETGLRTNSGVARSVLAPDDLWSWTWLQELVESPYTRKNLNVPDSRIWDATPTQIESALAEGQTLQIQSLERADYMISMLCAEIQRRTSEATVGCNLYLTPQPGASGLSPHRDRIEAIIVQLCGKKRWRVWESGGELPSERCGEGPARGVSDDTLKVDEITEPGDVLHIRRGAPHVAECISGPSIHLTIGVHRVLGQEVLDWAVNQLRERGVFAEDWPSSRIEGYRGLREEFLSEVLNRGSVALQEHRSGAELLEQFERSALAGRRLSTQGVPTSEPQQRSRWSIFSAGRVGLSIEDSTVVCFLPDLVTAQMFGETLLVDERNSMQVPTHLVDFVSAFFGRVPEATSIRSMMDSYGIPLPLCREAARWLERHSLVCLADGA